MESLVPKIQNHLADVAQNPGVQLNQSLLESLDRHLSDSLPKEAAIGLITQIAALLPTLQQDPDPVTSLAEIIAESSSFTFNDVLAIKPPIPFVEGLSAEAPSFNLVTLSLLEKSGSSPSHVGILAGKLDVVTALIDLWLRTEIMSVATKAYNVLTVLLRENIETVDPGRMNLTTSRELSTSASGLMWRRITTDKDVYSLFFSLCSLRTAGQSGQLSKKRKTIAQGRLLDFLKDFCHAPQIWSSHIPEIETAYGLSRDGGLLEFAAVHMVDYGDDPLMHVSLVDFFTALISKFDGDQSESGASRNSSKALDFLISTGLHQRTSNYFLKPDDQDPLDITFLYPASARYLSAYVSTHSAHFLSSSTSNPSSQQILAHLLAKFRSTTRGELANDRAPKPELHLLSSIPRLSLLPTSDRDSLLLFPILPQNADVLLTLGYIFKGPSKDKDKSTPPSPSTLLSRAAARALFLLYIGAHPTFWDDLIQIASLVALKHPAKAALNLLQCLIEAEWSTTAAALAASSSSSSTDTSSAPNLTSPAHLLPSESTLQTKCPPYSHHLPTTGLAAILLSPGIEKVVPFLLQAGAESKSPEGYEVAAAKFEVLKVFQARLEAMVSSAGPREGELVESLVGAVARRVGMGVLGASGREGGGELPVGVGVATESR